MKADEQEMNIEEAFSKLEDIVDQMQGGGLSLEEAFSLYKNGISLVEDLNSRIEKIQCDIRVLNAQEQE